MYVIVPTYHHLLRVSGAAWDFGALRAVRLYSKFLKDEMNPKRV